MQVVYTRVKSYPGGIDLKTDPGDQGPEDARPSQGAGAAIPWK